MKNTHLHAAAIFVVAILIAAFVFFGLPRSTQVSADPSLGISTGTKAPPPLREEHQWLSPATAAVWIEGHNEWNDNHYVWLGGYYTYPPQSNDKWVPTRFSHSQDGYSYHPGHWSQVAGTPSPKGIASQPATYIHPVVQDNGVGDGDREVKNGLNRPTQADYHQSQAN